jgi:hypothetical protein
MTDASQPEGALHPQLRKWIVLIAIKVVLVILATVLLIHFYL